MQEPGLGMMGGGGIGGLSDGDLQQRQLKAEIATHPLYEQLLAAHVACLRVATPIDQLPLIEAQLTQSHHLLRSYASHHHHHGNCLSPHERQELDNFLVHCFCLHPLLIYLYLVVSITLLGVLTQAFSPPGLFLFVWLLLQSQYLLVLCTFKEQLQQHVRVHAVEAVMACREIEQTLQALTGTSSPPLACSLTYMIPGFPDIFISI